MKTVLLGNIVQVRAIGLHEGLHVRGEQLPQLLQLHSSGDRFLVLLFQLVNRDDTCERSTTDTNTSGRYIRITSTNTYSTYSELE